MERPRTTPGSPLPTTPQRRKTHVYQDLLAQFGSRSSATSVTKERRESSKFALSPPQVSQGTNEDLPGSRLHDEVEVAGQCEVESQLDSTQTPTSVSANDVQTPSFAMNGMARAFGLKEDEPVDEFDPDVTESLNDPNNNETTMRTSARLNNKQIVALKRELKMENRKKERTEGLRRSGRGKDNILESDTAESQASPTRGPKKGTPKRVKLDTARQRLRDEIALRTRAKADNFLIANREYFLPLLPANNYISKLLSKVIGDAETAVEYEELTEQPSGVKATMKPYQLSGLSFLVHLYNNGFSGILGDEMGLGKTLQTLSLFQYLEEQDEKAGYKSEELRPYLVLCPLSVLDSWVNEAQRWVPNLRVFRFHGSVKERDRLKRVVLGVEDMFGNETTHARDRKSSRKAGLGVSKLPTEDRTDSYKIIVTTYECFLAEQSWFKHSFIWRYVALDEGHRIKGSLTQVSTALRNISAEYRLILTGTPLQNNLVEMWALLAWLYPQVFIANTEALFKDSFDLTRGKYIEKTVDDARSLLELIMLRRMKDSPGVNLGLPPKEEVLLHVPLTPMQRFWYMRLLTRVDDGILKDLFSNIELKEKEALEKERKEDLAIDEKPDTKTQSSWLKLMNLVMQLRKACSHPYLLPGAAPEPYYLGEHVIRASGKFILLEKLLHRSIFTEGKKVLIFSGFTQSLDCCEDLLALLSDHGQKFKYLRLDGRTARARRNLELRLFNDVKSDHKVILLSTRAGGIGINLTSAEDVIFLDEDWNPQITLQAEARAHRIGQTKKVTIYKLCTQGTVEEQMMRRIRKKLYLSTKITESMRNIHEKGSDFNSASEETEDMPHMDTSQLKSLVRRGAQTLSHPEINATEMLSWDLDTMLQKCRDQPSDPQSNLDTTDIDEAKWLSTMERVECAVFDGKRYQRSFDDRNAAENILPKSITREDRRRGKNMTVMVDGFAVSKESISCAEWEAVPTLAGKDPRLANPKREKKVQHAHETHCLICFGSDKIIPCKSCPRSYHKECLSQEYQSKIRTFSGFFCPQHDCAQCGKKASDAGGMLYRCRWCESAFCEDCLNWSKVELIGDSLPEFEMLGEESAATAFFIKCTPCQDRIDTNADHKEWLEGIEHDYREQHDIWLKGRDDMQRKLEKERDNQELQAEMIREPLHNNKQTYQNNKSIPRFDDISAYDSDSPPPLTDTSLLVESGISTPRVGASRKRPVVLTDDDFSCDSGTEKKLKTKRSAWDLNMNGDMGNK
ncbi:SNF2 family N-terminal domain-containing protein [Dendryphion nanum]|uniref:SNF2 family N-terminal domain-containing protein n=1 Tax=Dendryphion nanum TaxID=256645 RepID=A0A9P9E473_9PLEO|nr:SNF2 family N-terminal domain-containing protein [Dendryphion nanum]